MSNYSVRTQILLDALTSYISSFLWPVTDPPAGGFSCNAWVPRETWLRETLLPLR